MSEAQEFTDFEIDLDLTNKKEWDGQSAPLPDPGEYRLKIMNVEQKPGNKAPVLLFTFEIQTEGPFQGSKVWQNYSLSDKAQGRLKSLMLAARTRLDKIIASDFLGAEIMATIVHNEGAAKSDENGNVLPSKTFANVEQERAIEEEPAAKAEPPPAAKGAAKAAATTAKATANGAPRRA